jgi:hypothetical protein
VEEVVVVQEQVVEEEVIELLRVFLYLDHLYQLLLEEVEQDRYQLVLLVAIEHLQDQIQYFQQLHQQVEVVEV